MPSYDNVGEEYVIVQNVESGIYSVVENTFFTFLGGSLRYGDAKEGCTNIRFGYRFNASVDLEATTWGWSYGVAGSGHSNYTAGVNYKSDTNITNLVITSVPEAYYSAELESRLVFEITVDGIAYRVFDRARTRSILGIAQNMVNNPTEPQAARDYAEKIVNTCA
jgi:hypothetical protein